MIGDVLHATTGAIKVGNLAIGDWVEYHGGYRRVAVIEPPSEFSLVRVKYEKNPIEDSETFALLHIGGMVHILVFDEERGVHFPVDAEMAVS